jgi:hypothetical protein
MACPTSSDGVPTPQLWTHWKASALFADHIRKTYQPGSQVVGQTDLIAEEPASEQSLRQEEGPSSQVVPAPSSVKNEIGPQPLTTEIDEYGRLKFARA